MTDRYCALCGKRLLRGLPAYIRYCSSQCQLKAARHRHYLRKKARRLGEVMGI